MIVYSASKSEFVNDVVDDILVDKINDAMRLKLNRGVGFAEVNSWRNSLRHMHAVIIDDEIPGDTGISIEYTIPQTGKRVDFIVTGKNKLKENVAVLIELKQWETATVTSMDAIVTTFVGKAVREMNHPSYQVWSYAELMRDFNQVVNTQNITLKPCAFLHNYKEDDNIGNEFYSDYLSKAPVFFKGQAKDLRKFIHDDIKTGDLDKILELIDESVIRPTKNLADRLESMISGNREFIMIDDQKVAYENVLRVANMSTTEKHVIIINGGPGTGKSVVAVNLLVELIGRGLNARYITKNGAPRAVYESKLTGSMKKSSISNLFTGSGSFHSTSVDEFDVLLVDEAPAEAHGGAERKLGWRNGCV